MIFTSRISSRITVGNAVLFIAASANFLLTSRESPLAKAEYERMHGNRFIAAAFNTFMVKLSAIVKDMGVGDAGRGFSVVADEIRKLAENAAAQSKLIGSTLKSGSGTPSSRSASPTRRAGSRPSAPQSPPAGSRR
jgi:hypothetical protein